MEPGVARQRRDALVEARVVLHRAGPERVDARVEVEVAAREARVVADDLRLRHLGQPGRLVAQQLGGDQLVDRDVAARDAGGGNRGGAAAWHRALEDRRRAVALHRRRNLGGGRRIDELAHVAAPAGSLLSAVRRRSSSSTSASRSIWAIVRCSVIATRRPLPYSSPSGTPAAIPAAAQWSRTRSTGASKRIANSRTIGASWSASMPSIAVRRSRA